MSWFIFLAVLNGICISLSRVLNGRLSLDRTAMLSSYWNHLIGFIFLSLLVLPVHGSSFSLPQNAPLSAYAGGVIGVLFVAINSFVLPRIGAMRTSLLVISGQMLVSVSLSLVLLFIKGQSLLDMIWPIAGMILILFGVYLNQQRQVNPYRKPDVELGYHALNNKKPAR
ncbi:DMT family transporter [Photobacterium sp. WH77]|uniref:DMT family transporter n=1 Tax=unclassified Photobacterium TaxID=2628852 RepID=UPI001EDA6C00|nr:MULTISPECIES: DMT family transporter [unclassified Photobacterium]MCG2837700.1 DMT family transporter [Photobacterium sp. WH77]MCG2845316.1 DMT family transporter [Photobacterium sp. WH80]